MIRLKDILSEEVVEDIDFVNNRMSRKLSFDEIEAIKSLIENNKRTLDAKVWKIEKKVSSSAINLKKIEETINGLNTNIQDVYCMVEVNSARKSATEEKSYNLGLSLKAFEN